MKASQDFFEVLNTMHPALRFTMEGESDRKLPFMDVLVERVNDQLVRSIYRKPTFTGLYTRWESYSPTNQKINLIKSLTTRVVRICSPSTADFSNSLEFAHRRNRRSFPLRITIGRKMLQQNYLLFA